MLAALRKRMLGMVAGVLRRWLDAVTTQLEAAPERRPTPEADAQADIPGDASSPPAPPEHWVELVRQHAPQLLGEDAQGDAGVFEYRADDAFEPATVKTRNPQARPVHAVTPSPAQAAPIPTVRTTPKRPMRLTNVRTTSVDAEALAEHSAQTRAAGRDLPTTPTAARDGAEANVRRGSEYVDEPRTERQASNPDNVPSAPEIERRFAELPVERRVREVWQGEMEIPDVPNVRTRAGNGANVNARRTRVPEMPQQAVFRPTVTPPRVNFEAVTPERWASLPETPQDEPRSVTDEAARRARLRREQEGRSWSE